MYHFVSVENQRLNYTRFDQDSLRSDVFANLVDAILAADASVGKLAQRIICPKCITGSCGNRHARLFSNDLKKCYLSFTLTNILNRYQDTMETCRHYHKPDLFIMFICYPLWPEIQNCFFVHIKQRQQGQILLF